MTNETIKLLVGVMLGLLGGATMEVHKLESQKFNGKIFTIRLLVSLTASLLVGLLSLAVGYSDWWLLAAMFASGIIGFPVLNNISERIMSKVTK